MLIVCLAEASVSDQTHGKSGKISALQEYQHTILKGGTTTHHWCMKLAYGRRDYHTNKTKAHII
jgi:hypothetical protein